MKTAGLLALLLLLTCARADVTPLDDFSDPAAWTVITSDGVTATTTPAAGPHGPALRLDYDFTHGAGFCVLRRKLDLPLPENYRFALDVRGQGPPNNFEFKLVDPGGDNVWWVNQRAFEFPAEWRRITLRARKFTFAWGPSGGAPLTQLGAIELAIAAAEGGRGSVWLDNLTFEPLPATTPASQPARLAFSSAAPPGLGTLPESGEIDWQPAADDHRPQLTIDLGAPRELGGLALEWAGPAPSHYEIALSPDGTRWETASTIAGSNGGRDWPPLPDAEAAAVRITLAAPAGLRRVRIMPPEFAVPNTMFATIARESPRGHYPRYFLGEQPAWTVVGAVDDRKEVLVDTDGAIEVDKLGFRLEPFLYDDGRLITWADVGRTAALADGYLPIPIVGWEAGDTHVFVRADVIGLPGASTLLVEYQLSCEAPQRRAHTLFVAIRPFQVLPPWHELNITGGASRITTIRRDGRNVVVNGTHTIVPWTEPAGCGAVDFVDGDIVEQLAAGKLPTADPIDDPTGRASAALRFDLEPEPHATVSVRLAIPLHGQPPLNVPNGAEVGLRFSGMQRANGDFWREQLQRVRFSTASPPSGPRQYPIAYTFAATQAYILINADGPAIQPGSRTYERSWIRDGALTSTALLYTDHPDRVAAFIDWYAPHQFDSGKVPCVVDRRGPDPVNEHDSTGELLYLLHTYYRFTKDRATLERHFPRVVRGVEYLEKLRAERLTPEYRDGPPEKRVCYGLLPESISHEGYSAKPMHSYWDNFFALRGIADAAAIAEILGHADLAGRWARLRDDYRATLHESIRLAMELKNIDYLPGCAELGDFDATSTAIAVFPCGEADRLPPAAVMATFDRYWQFFCDRRDGRFAWENYTPYELRLVGTFVRLGQPERAHALLDFFFKDQRPPEWRQWAEVVWRDPTSPRFTGDLPHTWVGSDFLSAVRSMFVYERERDGALVLAAGVNPEWIDSDNPRIERWPTEYGPVSWSFLRQRPSGATDQLEFRLDGPPTWPPGGVVVCAPGYSQVASAKALAPNGAVLEGVEVRGREIRMGSRFDKLIMNVAPASP